MKGRAINTSSILLRDGENRMRGISDNGYMSLYWYDADGNRTVKCHNGGDAFHLYLPITRSEEDKDNDAAADASDGGQRNHPTTLGEGKVYFYHRDHLGSTMSVTDSVGQVAQTVEYTPWGEVFVEQQNDSIFTTPYLFNGKELDEETGLYYYGARYYDPRLSVWYSTDPMQEKYPWVSTYTNTKNNPMRFIDPDGNDEWDINEKGFIVKHTTTTKHDAFFIINKKGKRINGGGLIFNYGTVEKATTQMNSEGNLYDVYQIRGDKSSSELFEYLAQKTSVEWNLTQTGVAGKKGLNFITTSHNHSEETGMTDFFIRQLQFGYTIRKNVHSHPENTPYPSGFNEEEPGDIQYAKKLTNLIKQSPIFQIYLPKKGKYINFGPNSIAADFNLNTIPEVIIESCKKRK